MSSQHSDDSYPFRILSLDGGGIRGAFSAAFLAEVERETGLRAVDCFDLIAGTSTGAIIAAALSIGVPAEAVVSFYRERGKDIFTRLGIRKSESSERWLFRAMKAFPWAFDLLLKKLGLDSQSVLGVKYGQCALRGALDEVFGDKRILDAKTRLIIPSFNLKTGCTKVFKTPHFPGLYRDAKFRLTDVLLATTAAPTYFPHAEVEPGSAFVDGGVWANNPAMASVVEALKICKDCNRDGVDPQFCLDSIRLLSIGTGTKQFYAAPTPMDAGVAYWLDESRLMDLTGISQSQGIDNQIKYLIPKERYRRVNFAMPPDGWSLDSVEYLDDLIHQGRETAAKELSDVRSQFFVAERKQFVPFGSNGCLAKAASE